MDHPQIPMIDFTDETTVLWSELIHAMEDVLHSGSFIMGPNVKALETELAEYLQVKHAVTLNSGTDALVIGLRAAGIGHGDEVITTAFTFFATGEAISAVGATPVFVDIDPDTLNIDPKLIEAAVTERTKAILPVHMFGQPADMADILSIAKSHKLLVIEDCAQSFGAHYQERPTGTLGDIGCYSFFPTKNLGAYGDGGLLVTNHDDTASMARMLKVHGAKRKYHHEAIGYNSRLDEFQAAILRVKLPHIDEWNARRQAIALKYHAAFASISQLAIPTQQAGTTHVYHQYTIRVLDGRRDALQEHLASHGVGSTIYYPVAMSQFPMYKSASALPTKVAQATTQQVLSLPIWPLMSEDKQDVVMKAVQDFYS